MSYKAILRSVLTTLVVALVGISCLASTASAKRYYGACGGGTTLKDANAGWKAHGVADDVVRLAGATLGLDGSSLTLLRDRMTVVRSAKGQYVDNYTCKGGRFVYVGRKWIGKGEKFFAPTRLVDKLKKSHPRGGRAVLRWSFAFSCGNKTGKLVIILPKPKKPAKPKKPKKPCNCKPKPKPKKPAPRPAPQPQPGCTVIVNGDNNGNAGCGNVQVCTINGSSVSDSSICSAYQQCVAIQGNTWNSAQNVCVWKTNPPPPPDTPKCPDGRPIPPEGCNPPKRDRPPTGEVDSSAAHMQVGNRHVQLYFIGSDPDGDNIVLDIVLSAPAGTYVSGKTKVTQFSDGRACPTGNTCWEATLWSGNTPGEAKVSGKFTGSDTNNPFVTDPVTIVIAPDQFPQT